MFLDDRLLSLWRFDQPALLLAIRIELGERSETAAHSRKDKRIFRVGNRLGHDSPAAVRKLVETPKLFGASGKGGQDDKFRALSRRQCPICSGNDDFEIGQAEVAARIGDRLARPFLL